MQAQKGTPNVCGEFADAAGDKLDELELVMLMLMRVIRGWLAEAFYSFSLTRTLDAYAHWALCHGQKRRKKEFHGVLRFLADDYTGLQKTRRTKKWQSTAAAAAAEEDEEAVVPNKVFNVHEWWCSNACDSETDRRF